MKIICIGRNYVNHAKELNNPLPEAPVFFLKPESALLPKNHPFFYPDFSNEIHYETELVVRINKVGKNIQEKWAYTYWDEIGIGIDFTARDLQRKCKEKGLPWEIAKAFDFSAPVSRGFVMKQDLPDPENIRFRMELNGEAAQAATSKDMIFSIDQIISYVSQFMTLKMGDLIFTGTPEGVGEVKISDSLVCYLEDQKMMELTVK
ncbi:MAG: fumarylacetoacetate hydrolase family protein [Bacteroidales bacterium]|nr:fumarylacetoacetate hydrolase family protein [Bacteroidales bacterium]